jgi:hypothetical protein
VSTSTTLTICPLRAFSADRQTWLLELILREGDDDKIATSGTARPLGLTTALLLA